MIILDRPWRLRLSKIVGLSKLVIDTRNATKDLQEFKDKIIKLGAGNRLVSPAP